MLPASLGPVLIISILLGMVITVVAIPATPPLSVVTASTAAVLVWLLAASIIVVLLLLASLVAGKPSLAVTAEMTTISASAGASVVISEVAEPREEV